jgi:hypothetical protein
MNLDLIFEIEYQKLPSSLAHFYADDHQRKCKNEQLFFKKVNYVKNGLVG